MNWQWSEASEDALATIDRRLRWCAQWVLARSPYDLAAREGYRDRATQERYLAAGLSNAAWGESAHNVKPARAIHLIPYLDGEIRWGDRRWEDAACFVAGLMHTAGDFLGVPIVWGGVWSFRDLNHYEIGE